MTNIYCFDIDHTIEVSAGPVKVSDMLELRKQNHVIGLCGNWAVFVHSVRNWHHLISLIGPGLSSKAEWLHMIKINMPKYDRYIMVGNNAPDQSQDKQAADAAGWEFIKESDFASGVR